MTKSRLPQLYFGFFAAYMAGISHLNLPASVLIMVVVALFGWQLMRPSTVLGYLHLIISIVFSLFYAGSIVRILLDNFEPFLRLESQIGFALNIVFAISNLAFAVYWLKQISTGGVSTHRLRSSQH